MLRYTYMFKDNGNGGESNDSRDKDFKLEDEEVIDSRDDDYDEELGIGEDMSDGEEIEYVNSNDVGEEESNADVSMERDEANLHFKKSKYHKYNPNGDRVEFEINMYFDSNVEFKEAATEYEV